eukprot:scaffold33057_cov38-Prasinocladus_malaysianus.AAC.1
MIQVCADDITVALSCQVRSSTDSAKRTFLEKKGLTAAEINEAFRRVPSEAAAPAQLQASNQTPTSQSNPNAPQQVGRPHAI